MREVLGQLRRRWFADEFDVQSKKELLRCVIDQVRLTTKGKVVRAEVVWQGGARSELDVPKYVGLQPRRTIAFSSWPRRILTPRSPTSSMRRAS
jgi:hypothetical protein